MPPEAFEGALKSSPAIDVWAIGLMFYAMLYGTLPFYAEDEHMLKQKIRAAKLYFPSDVAITDMGKELLRKMLHKDPKERLDLLNFLEMDYYNIEDDKFEELVQHSQAEKAEELAEKARL
jgi:serine/threonine protein kinase